MDLSHLPEAGATVTALVGALIWITRSQTKTIESLVKRNGHEPNAAMMAGMGELKGEMRAMRGELAGVKERLLVVESRLDHLPGSRR